MDRSKPRSRRNRAGNDAAILQRVHDLTRGKGFKPPPFPGLVGLQPWNHATIRNILTMKATGTDTLTSTNIGAAAQKQLGLTKGDVAIEIEFKVLTVTAWNLRDTSGSYVRIFPLDLVAGAHELTSVESMATRGASAGVGFHYPASNQNVILDSTTAKNIVMLDAATGNTVEVHTHIMWRGATTMDLVSRFVHVPVQKPRSNTETTENDFVEAGISEALECMRLET